jgi:predicted transcriptional regulator
MTQPIIPVFRKPDKGNAFMKKVLTDLDSMARLFEEKQFETGVHRIGAEQELHLIDENYAPLSIGADIMNDLRDPLLCSEYAQFNLEINAEPLRLTADAFGILERNLRKQIKSVDDAAAKRKGRVLLTGILPTLTKKDLRRDNLSPGMRYKAMLDLVNEARGEDYEFHIEGEDKLISRENPVIFGGAFTSFQVHLQIDPYRAAEYYNWAQAISAPVMAACVNSPLFLNKKLWQETRISLFPQTADTRRPYSNPQAEKPRVFFGNGWVEEHILEVFREDVTDFEPLVATDLSEDSQRMAEEGKIPCLEALNFFNGTIYRWNRPCYGITKGKPHIRLENRYIPAGPTLKDEVANSVFWIGLILGMKDKYSNVKDHLNFNSARSNFFKTARYGLGVSLDWLDERKVKTQDLLLEELLPLARGGLESIGSGEVMDYLSIVESRVKSERTGAAWMLKSFESLRKSGSDFEACRRLVKYMAENQMENKPVHEWEDLNMDKDGFAIDGEITVARAMHCGTETVNSGDLAEIALKKLAWKEISHLPVINDDGSPIGLITRYDVFDYMEKGFDFENKTVDDIMVRSRRNFDPGDSLREAIQYMRQEECGAVLVVEDAKLKGILTKSDVLRVSEELLNKNTSET